MTSKSLPRSTQISEKLIREIASGLIPDGSRLPTERQMASNYNVAVGTLRKALATLEEKGLLERKQGSGNYVRRKALVKSIYAQFCLELPEGGGLPTATILATEFRAPPIQALSFGFSETALRIDRIRSLDNQPVALERIWLNTPYSAKVRMENISESLYAFYRDNLDLIISRVEDSISISVCPEWASLPGIQTGSLTGYIQRRAWSQTGHAAEFSQTWFNAQNAHYINRIESSPFSKVT